MNEKDFFLVVRADCEATGHAVADAQLGERATRGFVDIAVEAGMLATLLVIPTDLEASAALYRQIAREGHEVGLHVHPADMGYQEFLGVYGPDEQRKIIAEAAMRFAEVMGYQPKNICIGYGSANDYTYSVFAELGFTHGHISIPGRILPECASVWAGAPLDMHYAHPYNRVLAGTLDFVEIAQTLDPDSRMWGGKHPQDLRVELVDAKNHWYTIAKAVDRHLRDEVPVKYIHIVTHNTFDYSDPHNFRRETLEQMIQHTKDIVGAKGAKVEKATMAILAEQYRRVHPLEKAADTQLTLDTRGRS